MDVPGKNAIRRDSLATIALGSEEDPRVYCQPCDPDGSRLPAYGYCTNCSEHLCETCYTLHRKHKLSRDHTLLDKSSMPQILSPVTPTQSENFTKPCPTHNMEMIKFYCHDHKTLLCSVCVTLDHKLASCQVKYIPDISDTFINSTEYQAILKKIDDVSEISNKTLQDTKKMIENSDESLTRALEDFMKFRTKFDQRLNELERQVKEAVEVNQEDNKKKLMKLETECKDVSKSLKSSSGAIQRLNRSTQANDMFIEMKHAEEIIKDFQYQRTMATLYNQNIEVKDYNFEPNEVISYLLDEEFSLGTLQSETLIIPDMKPRHSSYMDKICVLTSNAKGRVCCIQGMTLPYPNTLILTDDYVLKMVDIKTQSVIAEHFFQYTPLDVASVAHNRLAVVLLGNESIQFMSFASKKFKMNHTVKVDGQCCGISCHRNKMVVTFQDPPKVQILQMNGTVLHTIEDKDIFNYPMFVTTCDSSVYVSDYIMETVTRLNWKGEMGDRYACRDKPYGLTMSENGTVFACVGNGTIIEISGDCTKGRVVVKDLEGPSSVCWSEERSTLYVSSMGCNSQDDGTTEDDFISMFKLTK
jgi:hypothetical protein